MRQKDTATKHRGLHYNYDSSHVAINVSILENGRNRRPSLL